MNQISICTAYCAVISYAANQVLVLYKDYIQPCLSLNKSIFIWLWETWVDYWMWHQSDSLSLRLCDTKNHWALHPENNVDNRKDRHYGWLCYAAMYIETLCWHSHCTDKHISVFLIPLFSGENPRASQRGLSSGAHHPGQNYFCHLVSTVPVIIYLLIFHMPHLGPM